ncbi:hypothetical protein BU14_2511s0001, partial [Porphyra umbilicalis]
PPRARRRPRQRVVLPQVAADGKQVVAPGRRLGVPHRLEGGEVLVKVVRVHDLHVGRRARPKPVHVPHPQAVILGRDEQPRARVGRKVGRVHDARARVGADGGAVEARRPPAPPPARAGRARRRRHPPHVPQPHDVVVAGGGEEAVFGRAKVDRVEFPLFVRRRHGNAATRPRVDRVHLPPVVANVQRPRRQVHVHPPGHHHVVRPPAGVEVEQPRRAARRRRRPRRRRVGRVHSRRGGRAPRRPVRPRPRRADAGARHPVLVDGARGDGGQVKRHPHDRPVGGGGVERVGRARGVKRNGRDVGVVHPHRPRGRRVVHHGGGAAAIGSPLLLLLLLLVLLPGGGGAPNRHPAGADAPRRRPRRRRRRRRRPLLGDPHRHPVLPQRHVPPLVPREHPPRRVGGKLERRHPALEEAHAGGNDPPPHHPRAAGEPPRERPRRVRRARHLPRGGVADRPRRRRRPPPPIRRRRQVRVRHCAVGAVCRQVPVALANVTRAGGAGEVRVAGRRAKEANVEGGGAADELEAQGAPGGCRERGGCGAVSVADGRCGGA